MSASSHMPTEDRGCVSLELQLEVSMGQLTSVLATGCKRRSSAKKAPVPTIKHLFNPSGALQTSKPDLLHSHCEQLPSDSLLGLEWRLMPTKEERKTAFSGNMDRTGGDTALSEMGQAQRRKYHKVSRKLKRFNFVEVEHRIVLCRGWERKRGSKRR